MFGNIRTTSYRPLFITKLKPGGVNVVKRPVGGPIGPHVKMISYGVEISQFEDESSIIKHRDVNRLCEILSVPGRISSLNFT